MLADHSNLSLVEALMFHLLFENPLTFNCLWAIKNFQLTLMTRWSNLLRSTNSWPQKWANDKVEGLCRLYHGWPQKWANDKVVWCHKPRRLLNWFIAPGGWRDLDKSLFSITPRDGVTGLLLDFKFIIKSPCCSINRHNTWFPNITGL